MRRPGSIAREPFGSQLAPRLTLILAAGLVAFSDGHHDAARQVVKTLVERRIRARNVTTAISSINRKAHLSDTERVLSAPGSTPPALLPHGVQPIGLLICYDLEIPEWVRMPAMDGAQLLCTPVDWPAFATPGQ